SAGYSWELNTSLPLATLSLTGEHHGSYLPSSGVTVNLHPPSGSSLQAWINWTIDQGGATIHSGNNTSTASTPLTGLADGTLWVNLTVGDVFGRSDAQSWQFQVDGTVGTLPGLALTGTTVEVGGTTVASPTTVVTLSNLTDDPSGVGYSSVECRNGSSAWTTVSGSAFAIPSLPDAETAFSIECRISDLLGNLGASSWTNGTVDALAPTVSSVTPLSSSTIALNSSLGVTLSDGSGMGDSQLVWAWTDGSTVSWANQTISSEAWAGAPSTLFGSVGDGTITLVISAYDALGNLGTSAGYSWELNTSLPLATLSLTGEHHG
ncbi:MAG: hypothetical protein QGI41_10990, partial [Acidimicrobiales bacterium]|nr:hypothetical protein [Acidimicrobiales bacterium]